MTAFRRAPFLLLLGLAALPALACRSQEAGRDGEDKVVSDVQHGRYGRALEHAKQMAEENPDDERAQTLYRDAQVALIMDQARKEIFRGDPTHGLELLEGAWRLAPGHPAIESWIEKTRAQLAVHWLDVAADNTGPEHIDDAELAYEKVLEYDPDNVDARRGLAQLLLLKNYRGGMSKTYFDDGLTSFREFLLEQAKRGFTVSRHYAENEAALARGEQVETLMAEERLRQARNLEADGLFFAARNEYRLVLLIDPQNVDGRAGLDRMDREARATRIMAEADMAIRRGQLDTARETLAEAEVLTDVQEDAVSLLHSGIEEKRLDDMYTNARSLTEDYKYPEAVVAYDELLAIAPDFRDAGLRKATLEEFIHLAEDFYAKATETTDDAVAEEYLRAIHPVIWPEYRDVVERLKAIEARKAAKAKDQPAEEPAETPAVGPAADAPKF